MTRWESDWQPDDGAHRRFVPLHHPGPGGRPIEGPREVEADAFAEEWLIPSDGYERFCLNGDFSLAAIQRFASKIGIAPGIVAGRLQHEPESNLDILKEPTGLCLLRVRQTH